MEKFIWIPLSLLWASPGFCRGANPAFTPAPHLALIDSGIRLTVTQDYPGAIALFGEKSKAESDNPLFPYFLLLIYESMMIDYETRIWEKKFDSLYERSESGFRRIAAREPGNAWAHYFLGNLYVTQGVHALRFSNYLSFTQKMFKGLGLLDKAVELDSALVDAHLYPALFQFAKSKLFHYLPLVEEDPQEAFETMDRVRRQSLFSKELAGQVMAAVLAHEGQWARAESLAVEFKRRFPESRSIYWVMANGYLAKKEYFRAKAEFDSLAPRIEKIPPEYSYNRLALKAGLARIALETGRFDDCIGQCDAILSHPPGEGRASEFYRVAGKLRSKALRRKGRAVP